MKCSSRACTFIEKYIKFFYVYGRRRKSLPFIDFGINFRRVLAVSAFATMNGVKSYQERRRRRCLLSTLLLPAKESKYFSYNRKR